ncbi:cyanate permease [Kitasatospora sp. MAA19]|uniref:hypothetical protein n=1 Tax=Kitasatospora sp. MAA19 TaxID=3035090 RepID=UPI0024756B72|nr:hypothetical protein [Kitasatospora sp. MAA19]MDH6709236.1 cyanate permease [Kitasatospora sp. MAA19]
MGLFAPLGALARRRIGEERGLFWASVLLVAGAALRPAGLPGLYAGTVLVGVAVAVAVAVAVVNVLIPVFVRARFAPQRIGTMMGVYALSMGAGSAVVAALVAPVASAPVWAGVLGIGMGGGQALAGVLFVRRGTDHDHVAALSTMAQTRGYLLAATGPALAAALHGATGTWTTPLLALVALLLAGSVLSLRAGHAVTEPYRDPSNR